MVFSDEDKTLMKKLHQLKEYNARQLGTEFPDKGWWQVAPTGCSRSPETWAQGQMSGQPQTAKCPHGWKHWLVRYNSPELTAQFLKYHGKQLFLSHLLSASYERICSWNALRGDVRKSWLMRIALLVSYFWRSFYSCFIDEKVFSVASAVKEVWKSVRISRS